MPLFFPLSASDELQVLFCLSCRSPSFGWSFFLFDPAFGQLDGSSASVQIHFVWLPFGLTDQFVASGLAFLKK